MSAGGNVIAKGLREQAEWCWKLGSPLYGLLLEKAADDVLGGGVVSEVLRGHERDPAGSSLALRFMGAVHRLALDGRAPELAEHFPSAGGSRADDPWPAFRSTVEANVEAIRSLLERGVQTNEVGRSAALLGGFLMVARDSGLPLALREVGASAGLNLRWDRYRYESGGEGFGPEDSPVRFDEPFVNGRHPPFDVAVDVSERLGCDLDPVDPSTEDGRLTLMSYVWPDQTARFARLRGALEIAARVPASVDRADAVEWVTERLAEPARGVATIVFHSVVYSYLAAEARRALATCIHEAGARASRDARLAWLRMEHTGRASDSPAGEPWIGPPDVRLTTWPGGEDRVIANAAPHGPPVEWLGPA